MWRPAGGCCQLDKNTLKPFNCAVVRQAKIDRTGAAIAISPVQHTTSCCNITKISGRCEDFPGDAGRRLRATGTLYNDIETLCFIGAECGGSKGQTTCCNIQRIVGDHIETAIDIA